MHANLLTTPGSQIAPRVEQHTENASIPQPENLRSLNHIPTTHIPSIKDFSRKFEYPKCSYNFNHKKYNDRSILPQELSTTIQIKRKLATCLSDHQKNQIRDLYSNC